MIVMKKIFFIFFLGTFVFAGREFIQRDLAKEKLREFVCKLTTIRIQMDFGVKLIDSIQLPIPQRLEQIRKFDALFLEFYESRGYFTKNFTTPVDKLALIMCSTQMDTDKKRYDKELAMYVKNRQGQ